MADSITEEDVYEDEENDQEKGSTTFEIDELMTELLDTRRKLEAVQFAFQYSKAEKKEMLKMKDDKIENLESDVEQLSDDLFLKDGEVSSLRAKVADMRTEIEVLENEKKKHVSSGRQDKEDGKIRSKLASLERKMKELQKTVEQKAIESRSHERDKHVMQEIIENQNRLFLGLKKDMDEQFKKQHENIQKEIGKKMDEQNKKVKKVIKEEIDSVCDVLLNPAQRGGDGRSSRTSQCSATGTRDRHKREKNIQEFQMPGVKENE